MSSKKTKPTHYKVHLSSNFIYDSDNSSCLKLWLTENIGKRGIDWYYHWAIIDHGFNISLFIVDESKAIIANLYWAGNNH